MSTPFPLGRKKEHDPRSRAFPAPFFAEAEKPLQTISYRLDANPLNQLNLSACTGFSCGNLLNLRLFLYSRIAARKSRAYLGFQESVGLYSVATQNDQWPEVYPPTDAGSSGLGVCKAAQQFGYITEYTWAFGFDHFLHSMMVGPMLAGTLWTNSMFDPDPDGFVKPTYASGVAGGHEYLCNGVNMRDEYLWFTNSWGTKWGKKGRFRMTFNDFKQLLADGGDAVAPIATQKGKGK